MNASDRLIGIVILLLSTVSEAVGQLAFKRAADRGPVTASGPRLSTLGAIYANFRWIAFGLFTFVLDGLLWSAALYYLDVTVAHPIGSVVFVIVAVFSRLFLKEHVSPRRWLGIGLVLGGAAIVAFN